MFDVINDILRKKSGKSLERNDFSDVFSLYMIQRFISMSTELNVELLNATVNILYKTLTEEEHYKLMEAMLPRTARNGKYIKVAKKKESVKKVEVVDISATFEESSSKIEESLAFVLGEQK
jgi:hypothetical protein